MPKQPLYLHPLLTGLVGGLLPFATAAFELNSLYASAWNGRVYHVSRLLFLLLVVVVVVAVVQVVVVFSFSFFVDFATAAFELNSLYASAWNGRVYHVSLFCFWVVFNVDHCIVIRVLLFTLLGPFPLCLNIWAQLALRIWKNGRVYHVSLPQFLSLVFL